jgi:hypothetical protein
MVDVLLSAEAQRQVILLPVTIRARLHRILNRLQKWPHVSGAKPLRGKLVLRHSLIFG